MAKGSETIRSFDGFGTPVTRIQSKPGEDMICLTRSVMALAGAKRKWACDVKQMGALGMRSGPSAFKDRLTRLSSRLNRADTDGGVGLSGRVKQEIVEEVVLLPV